MLFIIVNENARFLLRILNRTLPRFWDFFNVKKVGASEHQMQIHKSKLFDIYHIFNIYQKGW